PLALRGLSRAFRVTPRSTTSRRAARNSRVSAAEMMRESDCSITSAGRNPSNAETASCAGRILPSGPETNTGAGAAAIQRPANSARCDLAPLASVPTAVDCVFGSVRLVICHPLLVRARSRLRSPAPVLPGPIPKGPIVACPRAQERPPRQATARLPNGRDPCQAADSPPHDGGVEPAATRAPGGPWRARDPEGVSV